MAEYGMIDLGPTSKRDRPVRGEIGQGVQGRSRGFKVVYGRAGKTFSWPVG